MRNTPYGEPYSAAGSTITDSSFELYVFARWPVEILETLDIEYIYPGNYAAVIAASGLPPKLDVLIATNIVQHAAELVEPAG